MPVLTDDEKAAENKVDDTNDEGKKSDEILYPDDKEADDKAEDKTDDADDKAEDKTTDDKVEDKDKVDDDKKAEGDKKDEVDKKTEVEVLVKAEDLQFPDGIKVDDGIKDELVTLVNDKDMKPGEKAQALIGLQTKLYAAQVEAQAEIVAGWIKDSEADKEIIGDTGDKMEENLAIAKKGMQVLNVEGLEDLLSEKKTNLGNHPIMIKAFLKIGRATSEDTFLVGVKGGETEPKTAAQKLYPND